MITAARPLTSDAAHWYSKDGLPVHEVLNKSTGGMRKTTLSDCRKLGLLPSPTSICKLLHREALVQWMIEQAVIATATAPRRFDEPLDDFIKRVIQTDREQDEEKNASAELGTRIHKSIRSALNNETFAIDLSLAPYVDAFMQHMPLFGRVMATEKILVGDGYAGMTDALTETDHEIWVLDFKCNKNIPEKPYNENRLQLAAYAAALGNTGDKRIRCANIHISTREPGAIRIHEIVDWQSDFKRFKLLLDYWYLTNGIPRPGNWLFGA